MLTRRRALLSGASLSLMDWPSIVRAATPPRVRHNVASPEGVAMLKIYAEGVAKMKALSGKYPGTSWDFQWFTHAIPFPYDYGGKKYSTKADLIDAIYKDGDPNKKLATLMWNTCQSHNTDPNAVPPVSSLTEDFFLPWHRMYVLYFEKIVAQLTGKPHFSLPYWNYTDAKTASLPEQFRSKSNSDPVFDVLYVEDRNNGVNVGKPIATPQQLNLDAMLSAKYQNFNSTLDGGLHGLVHVRVGGTKNMGSVPWAAKDPIFWLHHCNIDRIWAGWNALGHKNDLGSGTDKWMAQGFHFADEHDSLVTPRIRGISAIPGGADIDYTYDALPAPPTSPATAVASRAAGAIATPISSTSMQVLASTAPAAGIAGANTPEAGRPRAAGGPVMLSGPPRTVDLAPVVPEQQLRSLTAGATPQRSVYLVLNGVGAAAPPGIVVNIYLNLPANPTERDKSAHYVGTLNFFEAAAMPGMQHDGRKILINVTSYIAQDAIQSELGKRVAVTFEPEGEAEGGSDPMIMGSIELQHE